jgi:hypothetical protein
MRFLSQPSIHLKLTESNISKIDSIKSLNADVEITITIIQKLISDAHLLLIVCTRRVL